MGYWEGEKWVAYWFMFLLLTLILFLYFGFSLFFFFSFLFSFCFVFFLSLCFFYISCLPLFSSFFFPHFPLCTFMTFYTACHDRICHFYSLTTFGLLWVSFQDCSLVCWLPSHHHYTVLAVPHLIPKQKWFCFVSYSPWHSHQDKR